VPASHVIGPRLAAAPVDIQLRTVGPQFVDEQHYQASHLLVVHLNAVAADDWVPSDARIPGELGVRSLTARMSARACELLAYATRAAIPG
jgi:hypothetical protein